MKIILFSFAIYLSNTAQGQNLCIPCNQNPQCPPTVWCHPEGDGMSFFEGATAAADYLGRMFQGDACANANYAEQVYCYPTRALTNLIPCLYGEGTPQYTLCEGGSNGGGTNPDGGGTPANPGGGGGNQPAPDSSQSKTTAAMQAKLNAISKGSYKVNNKVRPVYFQSINGNKALKEAFTKYKKNEVVHTWKNNFNLILAYKYSKEGSTNFYAQFVMYDNKGSVIGYPLLIAKNNRTYIFDMIY